MSFYVHAYYWFVFILLFSPPSSLCQVPSLFVKQVFLLLLEIWCQAWYANLCATIMFIVLWTCSPSHFWCFQNSCLDDLWLYPLECNLCTLSHICMYFFTMCEKWWTLVACNENHKEGSAKQSFQLVFTNWGQDCIYVMCFQGSTALFNKGAHFDFFSFI
jgi:hypothetical protein